jgi:hypothetical protein
LERFSPWFASALEAPGGTAFVQVKVVGRLVEYPLGKSAMVWYGVISSCSPDALTRVLSELSTLLPDRELVWRYLSSSTCEARHEALSARFRARFGAAPGEVSPPHV